MSAVNAVKDDNTTTRLRSRSAQRTHDCPPTPPTHEQYGARRFEFVTKLNALVAVLPRE